MDAEARARDMGRRMRHEELRAPEAASKVMELLDELKSPSETATTPGARSSKSEFSGVARKMRKDAAESSIHDIATRARLL